MPSIGRNASPGEITMEEAPPPGPPSILSQRRAQGTACDWALSRLGAELELRRSGSSLGPSQ